MSKGGENERNVAKFLTKWLTGKPKPYMFWRQDASGGLATVHIENYHMTGDICSVHPDSEFFTNLFSIECKTGYPNTSFWQHFSSVKFGIEEFWKQALDDSKKSHKHPMLIYRKKNRKWIVGIDVYIWNELKEKINDLNYIKLYWGNDIIDCVLYDMEDFFNKVKPEDIKAIKNENLLG